MSGIGIVSAVGLTIILIALVMLVAYLQITNAQKGELGRLRPFGAMYTSSSSMFETLGEATSTGQAVPQISCPTGTQIQILNAMYQVYDPYGQCTATPTTAFIGMCASGDGACSSGGINPCDNTVCGGGDATSTNCGTSQTPLSDSEYTNSVCSGKCNVLNVSAPFAAAMNGQSSYTGTIEYALQGGTSGTYSVPTPCSSISVTSAADPSTGLPFNCPSGSGAAKQGYFVQGVYACVPAA